MYVTQYDRKIKKFCDSRMYIFTKFWLTPTQYIFLITRPVRKWLILTICQSVKDNLYLEVRESCSLYVCIKILVQLFLKSLACSPHCLLLVIYFLASEAPPLGECQWGRRYFGILPDACGLWPCIWTHFNKSLVPYLSGGGTENKKFLKRFFFLHSYMTTSIPI